MRSTWEKMISANMDAFEVPGKADPVYRPKRGGFVWVVLGNGDAPTPPPIMDRQDVATRGGHELDLDVSDPDFLVLHKNLGMTEYTHCIPWDAIADIIFMVKDAG
jgi:hypothetical protein